MVWWNICQTFGTGDVTILRVSVGWWCSGVHVTLCTGGVTILRISVGWWCSGVHVGIFVLMVLPY